MKIIKTFLFLTIFCLIHISCSTISNLLIEVTDSNISSDDSFFVKKKLIAEYIPIDISSNIIDKSEVAGINEYFRSSLISSDKVDISLNKQNTIIRSFIKKIGSKYLITIYITDLIAGKEIASISESFISLHEYKYVIDLIISKIEGKTLQEKVGIYDFELEVIDSNIETFINDFSELKNQDIKIDIPNVQVQLANEKSVSSILSADLKHIYYLFNDDQYASVIREVATYKNNFQKLTTEAQEQYNDFFVDAERLTKHAYERIRIINIDSRINEIVLDSPKSRDIQYLNNEINDLEEKEWEDKNEIKNLIMNLKEYRDELYFRYVSNSLIEMFSKSNYSLFSKTHENFIDLYEEFNNQTIDSKIKSSDIAQVFNRAYIILINNQISFLIEAYNSFLETENYQAAYAILDHIISILDNMEIEVDVEYTNYDIQKIKKDLKEQYKNIMENQYNKLVSNVNYYAWNSSEEGINESFNEFQLEIRNSMFVNDYYDKTFTLFYDLDKKFVLDKSTVKWATIIDDNIKRIETEKLAEQIKIKAEKERLRRQRENEREEAFEEIGERISEFFTNSLGLLYYVGIGVLYLLISNPN